MKIAINGFGRIGRTFFRVAHEKGMDIVAINDLADCKTLAHLLKFDSNYGILDASVEAGNNLIKVDDKEIKCLNQKDINSLLWQNLGIDLVIESTGVFRDLESLKQHIVAGAKRVVLTAPIKADSNDQNTASCKTIVLSVNEDTISDNDKIISMASCTTNCLAPILKILNDSLGIENAVMSTIHSYTMDQVLQDSPHKDIRRARSALLSIIPTTTGATDAVELVIPELKGKLLGISYRIPTSTVSIVDLVAKVKKTTSTDEINNIFKEAKQEKRYASALDVTDLPLVSRDFLGNPHGAIVDLSLTQVINENTIKVVAWYDNELGYSHRLVNLVEYLSNRSFENTN